MLLHPVSLLQDIPLDQPSDARAVLQAVRPMQAPAQQRRRYQLPLFHLLPRALRLLFGGGRSIKALHRVRKQDEL